MAAQPHELTESLIRSLPDQGPVVMVNLVRFRDRAPDGGGSGGTPICATARRPCP